jgi:hypothetical protein
MLPHSSRAAWLKLQNLLVVLALVVSAFGPQVLPVQAASVGTALQFNGTNQYVTFGNTRLTPGMLTNAPGWNTQANSKLGGSSLTSQYVTTGVGTTPR